MLSALDHCSSPVTIHLLYDANLSVGKEREEAYNKSCYQKIADKYGCELQYHHVDLPEWIHELDSVKRWTPGTLMRIALPKIITDIEKIIYFDCDMVINTDVKPLWNTNIDNYYLAAVPDSAVQNFGRKRKKYYSKKNIPINGYFCAGTLVINLRKLREIRDFIDTLFSYLHKNQDLPYLDQDMLNWFCQGEYVPLDEKMNIYTLRKDVFKYSDDCVLHYATKESKPWVKYNGPIDDYYWAYLCQVPWCENREKLVEYTRSAPDINRALSLLHKDFFSYMEGTKLSEIKEITRIGQSIIKSFLLWIVRLTKM